ncbi:MAG: efflux transporter outer membrane subunit [Sphingobium sp.]|jgi:NodT family efflux transporter outer membrane factor (OMF) lipoprotein|uniref:efflux transporter outer membrane subunit n=1 Tax=Sphingobium TaxID=165695 RepID=UPI000309DBED|nr:MULTISPECIES: efflux transporter outer membrane subunit [Sphingobium]MBS91405.1 RND transporter [Sphingobium sp.]OUC53668.1 RND transporter [Sphingobium sp. GW456-12-10-14-TSB1]TAJ76416.1 MAG: efflux transporter outer membrane subunit [Sphingobium sp.]
MRSRFIATLTGALLISGCAPALQDAPRGASVAAPIAWRTQLGVPAPVEAQWWQRFGDPQMSALVEKARANNPDVRIAAARVEQARATERGSRGLLLPSLGIGVDGAVRREVSPFGQGLESVGVQPAFRASYELDLFGKNAAQIDAASAGVAASEASEEAVRLSVTAATATGYITLLALDARLMVLEDTVVARQQALKFARDRAEVGYTSQLELRQAEAEYQAAVQLVPQLRAQIARQENALAVLSGDLPRTVDRGGTLDNLRQPAAPSTLPSELLRRRPDIAVAEYRLAAADAQMRAARAQFMPSINLGASAGIAISDLLADPISLWSVGGSILAPIFQGGRLTAQLDATTAQRDQAAWAYRSAALNAFREVDDRMAVLANLTKQEVALRAQRMAVADALRHASNRYRAGYTAYIEQIDAQRALLGVDLSLIQTRTDELTTLIGLYQAVGGAAD